MAELSEHLDELHREARKLVDQIEEGIGHYQDQNYEAVQLVVGLTHYGISHVATARQGVMDKLDEMGVTQD